MKSEMHRDGMTLVEALMTVVIIALLAAFIVPSIAVATRARENTETADKLRMALSAFELYAAEQGDYPQDKTPGQVPPEMSAYYFPYFKIDWWSDATPIGGFWDWDEGYRYAFSVSIHAPDRSLSQLEKFDALVDDGDLSTGKFRQHGSHYHYIIEE